MAGCRSVHKLAGRLRALCAAEGGDEWFRETALGIEFVPESGQRLSVTGGRIDYIRCNYDTRQSNATYQWILSFNHYVQDTDDTDARQALPARWQKRVAPHTYKKMPCACSAGGGRLFLSEKRLFCPKNFIL